MGDHRRRSRPDRMKNLRIITYGILLLSAHINFSNSKIQKRGPKRHQRQWSDMRISGPEIHNKAGVSHTKVHSKVEGSHTEVYEKLDKHSNLIEQTRNRLPVKDCPSNCECDIKREGIITTALHVRNCESDPIQALPTLFFSLPDITEVFLFNCSLTMLPSEIIKLPLQVVSLCMNGFSDLPPELLKLPQLLSLDLSQNRILELPQGIGKLTPLRVLNLSYNELETVPPEIRELSHLKVLDISYNRFQSLPAKLGNLSELMTLNISYNALKIFPCEIGKLTALHTLELQGNEITMFPNETINLGHLQVLNLSNNPVRELSVLPIGNLTQFICDNCSINTPPCELVTEGQIQMLYSPYNVTNIRVISFSNNNISYLPKMCKLLNGPFMEEINFHGNKMNTFHFSSFCTVESYANLRVIRFADNRIRDIDTSGSPLHQCFNNSAHIYLQNNRLCSLDSWPIVLSQYKSITLDVSGNSLSEFTNSAGSFLNAGQYGSVFRMQGNQIKYFMDVFDGWKIIVNTAESLNTLLKNAYFDLGHNPLVCDCVDYEVYRYIQTLRTDQYNNLMCHEPLSLRGQKPHHIPLINFVCDIDVNCPDGCTCTRVPHSQTINIICLSYHQTDIPADLPYLPQQNYRYQINISHQNLYEITFKPYLEKTTEIRLSNNSIVALKIDSSSIFRNVKVLHLDNNRLQRFPLSVARMTYETVVDIRLGGNPWVCDCEAMAMRNWLLMNLQIVKDKNNILCHSPPSMDGMEVMNIRHQSVCRNMTAVYVVATISGVMIIFIVYLTICNQCFNRRSIGSKCKEFDVFMCSSFADSEYVENVLIPELQKRELKVCYHRDEFNDGNPIHEAMNNSKCILVFFSNNFKASKYGLLEFHFAHNLDIQNGTRCLITIKDTGLDISKLDVSEVHYFQTHTYIRREDVHFWEHLEYTLRHADFTLVDGDKYDDERKEFDVAICSADADAEYVEQILIPELEKHMFRVCYQSELSRAEKPIRHNIEKCKRILFFLSNNMKASAYTMHEFHSALQSDIQNKTRRLITIKDTDLDMTNLLVSEAHYFQTHTYIRREDVNFWNLLEYVLMYNDCKRVQTDEDNEGYKEFDIFMCAAVTDLEYVENYLIPELEKRDFRVLYHLEHFHPGKPIHVNMSDAFEKSKVNLVFFSNNFKESGYSMFEFHCARDLDIQNKTRRLICIKDSALDMSKLDTSELLYFQTQTYIDRDDDDFWELLENELPRKRLGAQVRH